MGACGCSRERRADTASRAANSTELYTVDGMAADADRDAAERGWFGWLFPTANVESTAQKTGLFDASFWSWGASTAAARASADTNSDDARAGAARAGDASTNPAKRPGRMASTGPRRGKQPKEGASRVAYSQFVHFSANAEAAAEVRSEKESRRAFQEEQREKIRARARELRQRQAPNKDMAAVKQAAAKKTPTTVINLGNMTSAQRAEVAKLLWSPVLCGENDKLVAPQKYNGC